MNLVLLLYSAFVVVWKVDLNGTKDLSKAQLKQWSKNGSHTALDRFYTMRLL